MLHICVLIVLLNAQIGISIEPIRHDYALSLAHMLPLLQLKEEAVGNLNNYAMALRNRLSDIKLTINYVKSQQKSSSPLDILKKTRLLYFDMKKLVNLLKETPGIKEIVKSQSFHQRMPSKTDFKEGLYAINRLQSTYRLDPAEMAKGLLGEKQYRSKAWSSLECLMVGSVYYLDEKFQGAERWFQLALQKYYEKPKQYDIFGLTRNLILRLLMKASQSSGRYKEALGYAQRAYNDSYCQQQIPRLQNMSRQPEVLKPKEPTNKYIFKTACRMEYPAKQNLYCHYLRSTPFLRLAPIQAEQLNHDPPIFMYHNLIDEREINLLKNLSRPHLERSKFYTEDNKVIEDFSNLRTCKTMRLKDNAHEKLMKNLNQRVTDATGLSVLESEDLQITNYGIGGHLYEHQDSSKTTESAFWNTGNRIITALFYLSDVTQGGETVFPYLDLRVHTRKGSLLVWNNLLLNGAIDWRVLHISCPILMGDKWLATKWLREKPQMFIRRCPLQLKPTPEYRAEVFQHKFFGKNYQQRLFNP